MEEIILTVASNGNNTDRNKRYRLSISIIKARELFHGLSEVQLNLGGGIIATANINPTFRTTCPHFYSKDIHNWIVENENYHYGPRHPKKLKFSINNNILSFIAAV